MQILLHIWTYLKSNPNERKKHVFRFTQSQSFASKATKMGFLATRERLFRLSPPHSTDISYSGSLGVSSNTVLAESTEPDIESKTLLCSEIMQLSLREDEKISSKICIHENWKS